MSDNRNNKGRLLLGSGLMAAFVVVFALIFVPLFDGQNGLDYLDNLYNSISKDSAYYIPALKEEAARLEAKPVELTLKYDNAEIAGRTAGLLGKAGGLVDAEGVEVVFQGTVSQVLAAMLADSDSMYHNQGQELVQRYAGAEPKLTMYTWWHTNKALEKALNRANMFAAAKLTSAVRARAVEMSYNYYGIEPQSIGSQWFIVLLSLLFYVVYTMWYGFGVMYLFEGAGYHLDH